MKMKTNYFFSGVLVIGILSGCGQGKQSSSVTQEKIESRPMLFDGGEGYSQMVPKGQERAFDTTARFPKLYQTIFFSPTQPNTVWGEPNMTYHDGVYYLWYHFNNGGMTLATSKDGVYWREEGYTQMPDAGTPSIGESEIFKFDRNGPFVWWRTLYKRNPPGMRYGTTDDLLHFKRNIEYTLRQDTTWYKGRWDSFFTLPREEGGWMAVINSVPKEHRGCAFATSSDGLHWEVKPPVRIDIPGLPNSSGTAGELSAWIKLGKKYFIICDSHLEALAHQGDGYFSKVYTSIAPEGPYVPTKRNYLITNSPGMYDKIHYSSEGELLTESIVRTFPKFNVQVHGWKYHHSPFKSVISDGDNLWFRWWTGNEKMKVHPIPIVSATSSASVTQPILLLENSFDLAKGLVIEGNIEMEHVTQTVAEHNWSRGAVVSVNQQSVPQPADGRLDGFPEAAIDGNRETAWSARHVDGDSPVYELDFGAVQPVGGVLIRWRMEREKKQAKRPYFNIETSADRVNWSTLGEEKNPVDWRDPSDLNSKHASKYRTFFTGLSVLARYLRITQKPYTWDITDIDIYSKPLENLGSVTGSLPGIYFECEGGGGEAVVFEPDGQAHFGWVNADGTDFRHELTREIGKAPGKTARFRIVQRDDLAEIYLDDYHLQIINHRTKPTGRIGLITSGGRNVISELKAWYADPIVAGQ